MSLEDIKLTNAVDFMRAIVAHCIEGGSFRYLIYDRLGFGPEAYVPMLEAGGMQFTNACPVNMDPEAPPAIYHASVEKVVRLGEGVAYTECEAKLDHHIIFPGHSFNVGDEALCLYLSTRTSGLRYALELGQRYSAFELAEALDTARAAKSGE
jgi:hypothetical protein